MCKCLLKALTAHCFQNAAARILTRAKRFEHITPVLASLHWLRIKFCIDFKVLLTTFKALNGLTPHYLKDLLHPYIPAQTLSFQNAGLFLSSPSHVEQFTNLNLWSRLSIFKSRLKSYLYSKSFS